MDWSSPPAWMQGAGPREFWADVVEELRGRGRLAIVTRYQVAWFCQVLSIYVRAHERVAMAGGLVDEFAGKDPDVIAMRLPSAEAKVYFTALTQLRKLTKELGLNELSPAGSAGTPRDRLRSALEQVAAGGFN